MPGPEIVILAAVAEKNRVIGKDGKLPWHISEDLKRFKQLTIGHAVLMGRKTFESILNRLGKPLPDRRNLVLTKQKTYPNYPEVETFSSIQDAFLAAKKESKLFIIGGEAVFTETLTHAHRLELTLVEGEYDGDAFFPQYEHLLNTRFKNTAREVKEGFRFETYIKLQD